MSHITDVAARASAVLESTPSTEAYRRAARDLPFRAGAGRPRSTNPAHALSVFDSVAASVETAPLPRARALLMAAAVEGFSVERAGLALPDSIESLYPRALNRSIHLLESDVEAAYPTRSSDEFVKDARLVTGYSVPAGAQDVDLDHGVRSRSLLKHALTTGDPVPLASLLVSSIRDRWYEIHTDGRDLADFSEEGWRECYRRIAQLLQADSTAAGVVGTSWFFDPQLTDVSPHLAYLRALPVSQGAALLRNGPGELHTKLATSTSRTRRRLLEEGRYTPVCHTIVWPRDALLRWAASEAER